MTTRVLDLSFLSLSQGFVIQGDAESDYAGRSVSAAGDINGDGIDDVIVGADRGDDGGAYAGEAYVIYGTAGNRAGFVDLTGLSASDGFIIQGDMAGDRAGGSVSAAGDINGDGIDDIIVGAPNGDDGGTNAGEAYVIYGFRNAPEAALTGAVTVVEDTATTLDLADLDIIDVDATGDMRVVLTAGAGTLAATQTADVTVSNSSGGRVLTLVGTLAALNAFLNTDAVTYQGAPNATAPDTVSVVINDNDGSEDVEAGSLAITITPVNDAPLVETALADQAGTTGVAVSFTLPPNTFSDVDSDTLTLTTNELPEWLSFNEETGAFAGTPPPDAIGSVTITVTASDGDLSVSDTFDLEIGEVISGGVAGGTLTGTIGADVVSAIAGSNVIIGGAGDDVLAGGFDDDDISGGAGDDILIGDTTTQIAGADRLNGGTGDDLLQGGDGADTFVFATNNGDDTIGTIDLDYSSLTNSTVSGPDFVSGVDRIELNGFGLADGAAALALVTDVGGVATFADQGTEITFAGLTAADLNADDFQIL